MFHDGPEQLVVFCLGTERFAVALSVLEEVIDMPEVQRVPDAPNGVMGVASVRGTLVTVYDPAAMLNVVAQPTGAALLFRHDGRRVALAVDDVQDAIIVDRTELRSSPGVGNDGVLIGVIRRADTLIAVIDANALVDTVLVVREGEPR
jgi:purine-binding chemotaxis protein CheW